jgi:hypothetical protein
MLVSINVLLDNINILNPNTPHIYLGQLGDAAIGSVPVLNSYFIGYIDNVSVTHRTKTVDEILDNASLVAYYSFDCRSTFDLGPNLLHGKAVDKQR